MENEVRYESLPKRMNEKKIEYIRTTYDDNDNVDEIR